MTFNTTLSAIISAISKFSHCVWSIKDIRSSPVLSLSTGWNKTDYDFKKALKLDCSNPILMDTEIISNASK